MKPRGPDHIDRRVAANVRRYRLNRGCTQEQLADAIGVSFQQLQKYENGINRMTVGRLVLLCNALAVDLYDMVNIRPRRSGEIPRRRLDLP